MPLDHVRIVARRRELAMTQTAAAHAAGMFQSAWARLERRRDNPKLSTVETIARVLGVRVDDLLVSDAEKKSRKSD